MNTYLQEEMEGKRVVILAEPQRLDFLHKMSVTANFQFHMAEREGSNSGERKGIWPEKTERERRKRE